MISSIKNRMDARRHDGNLDSGDVVQTVILIAGFVIVAIVIVTWLGTAIMNKAADAGSCIEGSNTYNGNFGNNEIECTDNHAKDKGTSFQKNKSYTDRYGNG